MRQFIRQKPEIVRMLSQSLRVRFGKKRQAARHRTDHVAVGEDLRIGLTWIVLAGAFGEIMHRSGGRLKDPGAGAQNKQLHAFSFSRILGKAAQRESEPRWIGW